jgi:hypothetical protein
LYVLLDTDPTNDTNRTHDRTNELISTLQAQLEAERKAHAEARRIIAGLVDRLPALEAPTDEPGSLDLTEDEVVRPPAVLSDLSTVTWDPGEDRRRMRRRALILFALAWFLPLIGLLGLSLSASVVSLAGIIASVGDAFATAISSGLSSVTGDQAVTIASTIITVLGTIAATYLGIRWNRRGRDQ